MRLFDGILMLFGVLCTLADSAETVGARGPKQAGDLAADRGEGSAHRMGGWNAGRLEGTAARMSENLAGADAFPPSGVPGYKPYNRRHIPSNANRSRRWMAPWVCIDFLNFAAKMAKTCCFLHNNITRELVFTTRYQWRI